MLTNLQFTHKNDERLAVIDFHKKFMQWIGLLTEPTPSIVNDYDNEEIQSKIYLYDRVYQEVLLGEALLGLYVEDTNLIKLISNLKIQTIKNLSKHPSRFLIDLKHNNVDFEQCEKMSVDTEENIEIKYKRQHELLEKRRVLFEDHGKKMIEGLKMNISFENEYRNYIKEYLKSISQE